MKDLAGRSALLTGASSGLGPFLARRLHREGVRLTLSARRRPELARLARELVGSRVITADLTEPGEVERLAGEAGPVDLLLSNAGLPASGPLLDFEVEQLDRALAVNTRAGMVLARLLLPAMLERGSGHLLFMASMAGLAPVANMSVYNATKFALRGFSHALRVELSGTGVGVSVIAPSFVSHAGMWAVTGERSPFEVSPEQVADAVHRAIVENRAESMVAPLPLRFGGRLAAAMPELVERFGGSAARMPSAAVDAQRQHR